VFILLIIRHDTGLSHNCLSKNQRKLILTETFLRLPFPAENVTKRIALLTRRSRYITIDYISHYSTVKELFKSSTDS